MCLQLELLLGKCAAKSFWVSLLIFGVAAPALNGSSAGLPLHYTSLGQRDLG